MRGRPLARVVVAVLLFVAVACGTTSEEETSPTADTETPTTIAASPPSAFEAVPCRFENTTGFGVECGDLSVPEDRSDPDSPLIRLHVAVFPAVTTSPAPDALVYLDGGPGGETLERLKNLRGVFPFLEDRDLVIFDQRGVGFSEPSLGCPEVLEVSRELLGDDPFADRSIDLELDAWERCRDRLVAGGVDLSAYNSAASAVDVAQLRRALGYESWNILGSSYGSRLALTVMRDEPGGVRAVILDSTYPPHRSTVEELAANFDRALDVLFASCAEDPACATEYPDLQERFFALVDRLEADPVTISIVDVAGDDVTMRETFVDGSVLMALVFEGLYSPTDIRVLPRMIEEIENETYRTVSRLASRVFAQREALSVGMHVSVQCHEEVPFTTTAERAAAIEPYPELDAFFEPLSLESPELCELWPAGFGGDLENQPVTSDLPALVLAGQFDPITPPAWGRSAAETLPNSIFYEFPSIGHSAVFTDDCPNSLAREFLRDPTTAPDSSCIADIAPIAFTP